MTAPFLTRLEEDAAAAARREQDYRRAAAAEIARLEAERAYAYRRFNALKDMARAAQGCETAEEGCQAQLVYVFKDIGWIGTSLDDLGEDRKEVAERLKPVAEAIYAVVTADGAAEGETIAPERLFAEFEAWFETAHNKRFLDAYETYVDTFMYPDA
ncbi:MAG: hypothetical protein HC850_08245 [Rhodomicrobium sp.]|nr:hypothetical protein [Rhodomicrobium sp.]